MAKPSQRYPCDRCHGQKLRCIYTENGLCVRCAKAKATCSWSQSLRSRRPDSNFPIDWRQREQRERRHVAESDDIAITQHAINYPLGVFPSQLPSSSTSSELDLDLSRTQFAINPGIAAPPGVDDHYISLAPHEPSNNRNHTAQSNGTAPDNIINSVDWLGSTDTNGITQGTPEFCWQQLFNQEWALLSSQPTVATKELPPTPVGDMAGSNMPKPPCLLPTIRQLSELNVKLYAHLITVPNPPVSSLSEPLSWKNKDFAIDRTFQLSQKLIEIANNQFPLYLETACTNKSKASTMNISQSPGLQIDQGFCLLILSCYTRLIETYDRIFANMQACLDRSAVTAREDYVSLPSVQVGSFSRPRSSATQIVLILQLARHLLTRMGGIIKVIGVDKHNDDTLDAETGSVVFSENTPGTEKFLLLSALSTVNPQEDGLMERITKLRSTLIELNIP